MFKKHIQPLYRVSEGRGKGDINDLTIIERRGKPNIKRIYFTGMLTKSWNKKPKNAIWRCLIIKPECKKINTRCEGKWVAELIYTSVANIGLIKFRLYALIGLI